MMTKVRVIQGAIKLCAVHKCGQRQKTTWCWNDQVRNWFEKMANKWGLKVESIVFDQKEKD